MPNRYNLMVAATKKEGEALRKGYPQFRQHLLLTPKTVMPDVLIDTYVWTPEASKLPAKVRMQLRGQMAAHIDERTMEEEFPLTLLSW